MKERSDSRIDLPPAAGLEGVRAALQAALVTLNGVLGHSDLRVRFLRPSLPYAAGEEVGLPGPSAIAAVQRGDAEFAEKATTEGEAP